MRMNYRIFQRLLMTGKPSPTENPSGLNPASDMLDPALVRQVV
jgi:hypothetical protein